MKSRKSDCAGEGDKNVRGWEGEWIQVVQFAGLSRVCVCVCACVRVCVLHLRSRSTAVRMISVLLLFTFQALQRGNQWVWWDQQGLVLLDLYKHHLLRSAESLFCPCAIEYIILKLYTQVVAMEKEVRSQFNCCLCWLWFK